METTTQPKKPRKLTKKQRGFVKDYVLEENGTKAAMNNYDVKDETVAASISTENLSKPYIAEAIENKRKTLKDALSEEGIDEKYIASKINVLLKAKDDKGNTDFTAVDKGLKHTLSIHGVENPEDKPKQNNTYNFIFNTDTQDKIRQLNEAIKIKLINGNT